jgi:hypothetical protein
MRAIVLLLVLCVASAAFGDQVYDAKASFSAGSNPNGVWSYGHTATLGAASMTVYPDFTTVVTAQTWYDLAAVSIGARRRRGTRIK